MLLLRLMKYNTFLKDSYFIKKYQECFILLLSALNHWFWIKTLNHLTIHLFWSGMYCKKWFVNGTSYLSQALVFQFCCNISYIFNFVILHFLLLVNRKSKCLLFFSFASEQTSEDKQTSSLNGYRKKNWNRCDISM